MKETLGDAKNAAQEIRGSRRAPRVEKTEHARNNLSESIDEAKQKIKDKLQEL